MLSGKACICIFVHKLECFEEKWDINLQLVINNALQPDLIALEETLQSSSI